MFRLFTHSRYVGSVYSMGSHIVYDGILKLYVGCYLGSDIQA